MRLYGNNINRIFSHHHMISTDFFGSGHTKLHNFTLPLPLAAFCLHSFMQAKVSPTVSSVIQFMTIRTCGFFSRRSSTISFIFPEDPPIKAWVGAGSSSIASGAVPAMILIWSNANFFLFSLQKCNGCRIFFLSHIPFPVLHEAPSQSKQNLCPIQYHRQQNSKKAADEKETHCALPAWSSVLCHAEILHRFGNCHAQFSTQSEKMVNSMARSEYYGSMVENRNFLLPKFFRRKTFNLNKWSEIYFNAILFSYVVIGRFLWRRLRLRH